MTTPTLPSIMVDIETMGIRPTSAIASIGAVRFDPRSDWIGETFHIHVSLENCQRYGLTTDASTITWWLDQDDNARRTLVVGQIDPAPLVTALTAFAEFFVNDAEIWCNGNSYDFPILAHAYHAIGQETPWRFYHERDLRTLKGLYPDRRLEKTGIRHHALQDAIDQARLVQHLLRDNRSCSE